MKTKKIIKNKKGFSIAEVSISMFALSVGLIVLSSLMANNIRESISIREEIISNQLSQEGLELVRNLKDNYGLASLTNGDYEVWIDSSTGEVKKTNGSYRIYIKDGYYGNDNTGNSTKFLRKINIDDDASITDGKKITSMVSWNGTDFPAACNSANKCSSSSSVLVEEE